MRISEAPLGSKGRWREHISSRETSMSKGPEEDKACAGNYSEFRVAGT